MTLDGFIGNAAMVSRLRSTGLPQSSILSGPEGVGKRTLALLLATRAQCAEPAAGERCGQCPSCRAADEGTHPDIFLVEPEVGRDEIRKSLPAGVGSVEALILDPPPGTRRKPATRIIDIHQIRELNKQAHYRPYSGRERFFIIDPADLMRPEAANALLKTLEEPAPTTHIVLVTALPDSLLPTILSRCQQFRFGLLDRSDLAGYLQSQGEIDQPELRAAFAGGSLGRALRLDLGRHLEDRDRMVDLLERGMSGGGFRAIFEATEEISFARILKDRTHTAVLLDHLEVLAFDLYYVKTDMPERMLNEDRAQRLGELAASSQLDLVRRLLHHIGQARSDLQANVRPQLCLETLWLDLEEDSVWRENNG